ncbi:MAG: hypothetical protein ACR2HN_01745 [Tepidiformaceae bacterium]
MAGELVQSRYCAICGAVFGATVERCPECQAGYSRPLPDTTHSPALMLTEITAHHADGTIDDRAFFLMRSIYEERLAAVRPRRQAAATPAPPAVAPPIPLPPRAATPPPAMPRVPAPPRPPRADLRQWAAARQADLLLYVGAFLLAVSAIIFVDYQGGALSDAAQAAIFAGYTGLLLQHG